MRTRIEQELALLRGAYPEVEHLESNGEDWFRLPAYPFPDGWRMGDNTIEKCPVVFKLTATYPTAQPYGFMAPNGINFKGAAPGNSGLVPISAFPGTWIQFSWQPDGNWEPKSEAVGGSNILSWVRSFAQRLKEGA